MKHEKMVHIFRTTFLIFFSWVDYLDFLLNFIDIVFNGITD